MSKPAPKTRTKSAAGLSKSRLMAFRQCPKRLWLATHRPELADESGAQTVFAFGNEVGEVARRLHPGGLLIDGANLRDALRETQRALSEKPAKPLYEATFDFDGTLIRADLLLPARGGYRLVEVKSGASVKACYHEDVAIQAWVMKHAGVPMRGVELAHVNTGFVYPGNGDYKGLLKNVALAGEITALVEQVGRWVKEARRTLAGSEPAITVGPQCRKPYACPFLEYCSPPATKYPVEDLHRGGKLIGKLHAAGYSDLRKVPAKLLTKPVHRRIHRAITTGKPIINPNTGESLKRFAWPRYYFDFETIMFVVPIWAGTRPYQQIPFQWSCHRETNGGEIRHREFLAAGAGDPRRAVAESLIEALGTTGPILAYNAGFEKRCIKELASAFPGLASRLIAVHKRIVDLLPIVRANYYHPAQHGSWSLKAVLPTIAPDLDYSNLEVSEGGMAADTFRALLDPAIEAAEAARMRAALLEYCGRDTLALVRIAAFLRKQPARVAG